MKKTTLPSIEKFKEKAKQLKKEENIKTLGEALNILAKRYGYKNWFAIKPVLPKPLFALDKASDFQEHPASTIILSAGILLFLKEEEINDFIMWYKNNTILEDDEFFELIAYLTSGSYGAGDISELYFFAYDLFYRKIYKNIVNNFPEERLPLSWLAEDDDWHNYVCLRPDKREGIKFTPLKDISFLNIFEDKKMRDYCFSLKGELWEGHNMDAVKNPITIEDFTATWKKERQAIGLDDKVASNR